MKVALYLRRSTTDLQPDSLDAQRALLTQWAEAHQHQVVATFADSASGRFIDGRDEFLRMIEIVKGGAPFDAILVRDVSRWSRSENLDLAGFYEFTCRSNRVAVIFVEESFGTDPSPYALMMKNLKRAMAAEFSLERVRLTRAAQLRTLSRGFWPTGSVPFGLKRVLVDESGGFIRDMAPGDRKALSSQRIKFAPGESPAVGVVQQIFKLYGDDGMAVKDIADKLNSEGVPSSKGSVWTPAMIAYVLQNEAYAGNLVYHVRRGTRTDLKNQRDTRSDDVARFENAHPAIVDPALWRKAQDRMRSQSWRKTDEEVLTEMRAHLSTWRPAAKRHHLPRICEVRAQYGKSDDSTIAAVAAKVKADLRQKLAGDFHVDDLDGGFLLDHLLHLAIKFSLPHAKFAGLFWTFEFEKEETCDVTLGVALSPPPHVEHVESFLFRGSHFRGKHAAHPRLDRDTTPHRYRRFSVSDSLSEALRHAMNFRSTQAEKVFIEALKTKEKLSLREVADELGWPVRQARTMYRRLDLRGDVLPPSLRGASKRITVVCPHCQRSRHLAPATVLRLDTDVCFTCLHRPPVRSANTHVATCPSCGKRRLLRPSDLMARSSGLDSLCGDCQRHKNINARRTNRNGGVR